MKRKVLKELLKIAKGESDLRKFFEVKYLNTCLNFELKRAASTIDLADRIQVGEVIYSSTVQI